MVADSVAIYQGTGKLRVAIVLAAATLLLAIGAWVWRTRFATYHLATIEEGVLYRAGNRSSRELATAVRKVGARTVVCLVDDQELADPAKSQFKEEMSLLPNLGVKVERIAVPLGGWPSALDLQRFLSLVEEQGNRPVLVHCAQGVRRTGMMVAAYQRSVLGHDSAKTRAEALTFGHSPRTVGDIMRFIDVYDAENRTMSSELPASKE